MSKMYNYAEKSATLDTALRLKIILEKLGFEVFLTRDKDSYVELNDRCDYANKLKADLFISLHFNGGAPKDITTSGLETYCLTVAGESSTNQSKKTATGIMLPGNRLDALNVLLAWSVHLRTVNTMGTEDRAVKRARFAVLKSLSCPGILIMEHPKGRNPDWPAGQSGDEGGADAKQGDPCCAVAGEQDPGVEPDDLHPGDEQPEECTAGDEP
jgi:N-acetylmuramoyl-L-alanine amidase